MRAVMHEILDRQSQICCRVQIIRITVKEEPIQLLQPPQIQLHCE